MVEAALSLPQKNRVLETFGVRIPYESDVITPAIELAIIAGRFEAEEAINIPDIIEPDDVVLEIGAGIGFISTLLDRECSVKRVVAVEANPALMPYMAWLHELNGVTKVDRVNAVLSTDGSRSRRFYRRRDFWMGSLSEGPNPYTEVIDVPVRDMNQILRDNAVTAIVCDVEGAESSLFVGADLSNVTRIYLELHDHITGLSGISQTFAELGSKGFAYDPRVSSRSIVLFRKVVPNETLRPYCG